MTGDLEFGSAQSDLQFQACIGLAEWKKSPQKDFRAVFSRYPAVGTLFAAVATVLCALKKPGWYCFVKEMSGLPPTPFSCY